MSTDWFHIMLLNFVKSDTLLMEKGSHKRYSTLANLAVVWALWSLKIWAVLMSFQTAKQQLSTDWSYIKLLNFVKLSTLLMEKGSHKQYATLTTLAVVWSLCSVRIFFSFVLWWWALKDQNSCSLHIDRILRSLSLLGWALCWLTRVARSYM